MKYLCFDSDFIISALIILRFHTYKCVLVNGTLPSCSVFSMSALSAFSPCTDVAVVHVRCDDVGQSAVAALTVEDDDVQGVGIEPRVHRLADAAQALQGRGQVVGPAELADLKHEAQTR